MKSKLAKLSVLCCLLFLLMFAQACGGGGSETTTEDVSYERKPGMTDYISALEGDYSESYTDTLEAGGSYADAANATPQDSSTYEDVEEDPAEIEEADLYQIVEDTLYLVNSYTGLYIFDITDPNSPFQLSNLPFKGSPREMYIDDGVLFLIIDNYLSIDANEDLPTKSTAILKIDVSDPDSPAITGTKLFEDELHESRMSGDNIFVVLGAGYYYGPMLEADGKTDNQLALVSIAKEDLVTVDEIPLDGSFSAIQAEEGYVAVCSSNYSYMTTSVRIFSVSASNGDISEVGQASVNGWVADKFKIHFSAQNCFVISHSWENSGTSYFNTLAFTQSTVAKTATLTLARGEQQFASRFAENYCYLVTFENIDPLWTIDFSNPSSPFIAGELTLPGWSTYLEVDGDRLIAVGYNSPQDRAVVASLFDISDPQQSSLLSQVTLGSGYNWTPVDSDEKAFSFFKDEGLLAIPVSGYDYTGQYGYRNTHRMHLINYDGNSLQKKGSISGNSQFKRSCLHKNTMLAFSQTKLISCDISNRNSPSVTNTVVLARNIVDVIPLDTGFWTVSQDDNTVSFNLYTGSYLAEPNQTLEFTDFSFYALFQNGAYAYLLLNQIDYSNYSGVTLYVINTQSGLQVSGTLEITTSLPRNWYFDTPSCMPYYSAWGNAVQMEDDLLVLKTTEMTSVYPVYGDIDDNNTNTVDNLLLIDIANPAAPRVSTTLNIPYGAGEPIAENGVLYLSYWNNHGMDRHNRSTAKHYVVTITAADRESPVLSSPINIPGRLIGVRGDVLFTLEVIYSDQQELERTFNSSQISNGEAVLLDSLTVPERLWSITMGSTGDFAAGIVRPYDYYIMDVDIDIAPMGASSSETQSYGCELVLIDISDPQNLVISDTFQLSAMWAELCAVEGDFLFISTDWMILPVFSYQNGVLEVKDYNLSSWFTTQLRIKATNAYVAAGMFGVVVYDLD